MSPSGLASSPSRRLAHRIDLTILMISILPTNARRLSPKPGRLSLPSPPLLKVFLRDAVRHANSQRAARMGSLSQIRTTMSKGRPNGLQSLKR